ncbi:hypothetical protein [Candidatus Nitrosotalea okcheonensis]|uniref:Uncharacterized protein n=1 Tax=Candidatus Nitrosotalea okcheonensis TaxID=1903276 RepID=A0A2H1FFP8_9ARCH|nr:hypothetical protein [Candidatus Nitrosotalea okcheonensis]SMH71591.1 conserved protein of unknown function [Candidatus Nitrosotalea okcheonensis]
MTEFEEFAHALLDQLSVEINEEKEITNSKTKSIQAFASKIKFEDIEPICSRLFSDMSKKIVEFTGISVSQARVEFPELVEFKRLKGRKVYPTKESAEFVDELFTAIAHEDVLKIATLAENQTFRYLVYSTYAKGYISQISTTYGDFYESAIYLNKFILSSYPQIILYKQGEPYESRFDQVNSGYIGALKMTILEEQIHSIQNNLYSINKNAVSEVNAINEELAKIILCLDDTTTKNLYNYLQIPEVPDEYPVAKRANLFFILNPDNFIVQVLGPDVMTFTKVTVDPKISEMIPQLLDIYQRWLKPIQSHHAAFTTMEGMAEFAVKNILRDDQDFKNYLVTFANSDISAYQIRKSIGTDFTEHVFAKLGKNTYRTLIANPPTTRELKNPESYINRK